MDVIELPVASESTPNRFGIEALLISPGIEAQILELIFFNFEDLYAPAPCDHSGLSALIDYGIDSANWQRDWQRQ